MAYRPFAIATVATLATVQKHRESSINCNEKSVATSFATLATDCDTSLASPQTVATVASVENGSATVSHHQIIETERVFETVATVATVAAGSRENENLAPEPPETAVARRLDAMAAENARRRDWWTQAVEGWRAGGLAIRSPTTGESVTIHLPRGGSGR